MTFNVGDRVVYKPHNSSIEYDAAIVRQVSSDAYMIECHALGLYPPIVPVGSLRKLDLTNEDERRAFDFRMRRNLR